MFWLCLWFCFDSQLIAALVCFSSAPCRSVLLCRRSMQLFCVHSSPWIWEWEVVYSWSALTGRVCQNLSFCGRHFWSLFKVCLRSVPASTYGRNAPWYTHTHTRSDVHGKLWLTCTKVLLNVESSETALEQSGKWVCETKLNFSFFLFFLEKITARDQIILN